MRTSLHHYRKDAQFPSDNMHFTEIKTELNFVLGRVIGERQFEKKNQCKAVGKTVLKERP